MQNAKKQEIVKRSIMNACQSCKGYRCKDCASKVEWINILSNAGIPVKYWALEVDTFPGDQNIKERLEVYLTKDFIDKLYLNGVSLAFVGPYGVGKTFISTSILKFAATLGYSIIYSTMNRIVDNALSREEDRFSFKANLMQSDIVCIDEIDSRFVPSTDRGQDVFGANLEAIIRTRFHNCLPTLFCSNNSDLKSVFGGSFSQSFNSLFSEKDVKIIPVGGIDLRKSKV